MNKRIKIIVLIGCKPNMLKVTGKVLTVAGWIEQGWK